MSIEIFALSDRPLVSIAAWQRAIDREGFDLRLDTARLLPALSGHLPAHRGAQQAGFECNHVDFAEVVESFPRIEFGHRWPHALAFRCGGNMVALWGAFAAAAAYARATDGIVLDGESGEVLSPQQAAAVARDVERRLGTP